MSKRGNARHTTIRKRKKSDVMADLAGGAVLIGAAAMFMSPSGVAQAATMHSDQGNAFGGSASSLAGQSWQDPQWSQTTCGPVGPQGPQGGSGGCGTGGLATQGLLTATGPKFLSKAGVGAKGAAAAFPGAQGPRGPQG